MDLAEPSYVSPRSILIIDDDITLRSSLKQIFEYLNYTVHEAGNGKEGIDSYRQKYADIVLTDILMPEKDGLETIRELKREFPDVKIVAMSGGNEVYLKIAGYFGAVHYMRKPFSPDDIIAIINLTYDANAKRAVEKMIYNVSGKTITQTDKCHHDFSCLSDEYSTCLGCIGKFAISGGFLQLEEKKSESCPYLISYGLSSNFCKCPVRREIYQKYNV